LSAPAEIILGGDGITSVSVDSTDGQSIVVTPVGGTVVSVGSVESQSISVTSVSTEVVVQPSESPSISIDTDSITVEVATNTNAGQWPKNLRDLDDVVGDPTSGQVLIYNQGENNFQFADQTGGGGGGGGDADELTDYSITVTNQDSAFDTIRNFTYEKFTNMTDLFKDILDPYTKTSVQLTDITGTKNGSLFGLSTGQLSAIEVGDQISLTQFSYTVGDGSKVKDDSISILKDSVSYMSALSETATTSVDFSPVINAQFNTPSTDTYKITATDNGNPNGQEYSISSSTMTIQWRYRIGLSANSTIPTDIPSATNIYNSFVDGRLLNDPGTDSLDFTCSASNASDTNYTFLMWPSEYGVLDSALQNNSTDVTADFVLVGEYTVTNVNNVNISYYIYRTNDTGAFNDDVVITVKLKDA
jgi:hypothetical protein